MSLPDILAREDLPEDRRPRVETAGADPSRREAEREARLLHLETLYQVDRAVSGASATDEGLESVLAILMEALRADRAWLLHPAIIDPEVTAYHIPYQKCRPEHPGASIIEEPNAARAIRTALAEHLALGNAAEPLVFGGANGRPLSPQLREGHRILGQLVLVLRPQTGPPWMLGVHVCSQERTWTEAEVRLFADAGRRIGDALDARLLIKSLRESEERYRLLAENSSDVIWTTDLDLRFTYISPATRHLSGYPQDLAVQRRLDETVTPESAEKGLAALRAALEEDARAPGASGSRTLELELLRADGGTVWVEVKASLLKGPDGLPTGVLGVSRDITERRAAEERQARITAGLQAVLTAGEELMACADLDALYRRAVELARERLGVRRCSIWVLEGDSFVGTYGTDAAGRTTDERHIRYPTDDDAWLRLRRDAEEPRRRWDFIPRTRALSLEHGVWRDIGPCWRVATALVAARKWIGVLCNDPGDSGDDLDVAQQDVLAVYASLLAHIIERKRAEEERLDLEAHVQHTQRLESLGALAGGIAHDFNNVLSAILGHAELGLMAARGGRDAAAHLEQVMNGAERARDLVRQILAFSRRTEHEMRPVLLQTPLADTLRLLRSTLPATIEITATIDGDCPPVLADATQIHQVVMNLCTNAHYALGDSGRLGVSLAPVRLESPEALALGLLEPGLYACIAVSDDGCGMDSDTRRRAFDPFFTTKPSGAGSGLGLAVVHGIVTAHGGAIHVRSEVGRGTTVSVYLPCTSEPERDPAEEEPAAPQGAARILVVDDEQALLDVLRPMLESLGYTVTCATGGRQARDMVASAPAGFDLVLTDQTMPGLTGMELMRELRAFRPNLPVILSTGFSRTASEEDALAAGARGFLAKPYTRRQLAECVRAALDHSAS